MTSRLARNVLALLGIPLAVVIWTTVASVWQSPYLPQISTVAAAFKDNWLFARLQSDVLPSLWRFGAGYVIGLVVGISLGLLFGLVRPLRLMFEPTVDFVRAIPPIVLIPFFLVLFGLGDVSKILMIALGAATPVLLNTIEGVKSLDSVLADYVRAYQISAFHRVVYRLRWASPQIVAGARISLAIAFILMVTSEMVAATNGLGYFVLTSQRTFAIANMWSGILLLGLIGFVFSLLFELFERGALAWYKGFKASSADK